MRKKKRKRSHHAPPTITCVAPLGRSRYTTPYGNMDGGVSP